MNTSNSKIPLTMESLDLPQELYWDPKIEPVSPPSMLDGELFTLDDPTFLYNDNFAYGITLLSVEDADSLEKSACLELLNDEDFVVELMDMKDEECLLDHKASHYIDYETSGFPQPLDVVQQDMLPITKVQVANAANISDFQHADSSMILQQLTPPQSPPQFEAQLQQQQQQQLQQQEESVKQESKQLQYATDAIPTTTAAVAATAAAATAGAAYGFNNWMPVNEITPEIQLVDDIVNMRAQELQLPINWQQYNDDCESQASSTLCSSSSSSSSSSSPSPSSSIADADEDWQPGSSCSSSISSPIGDEQLSTASGKAAKKRTRTYGRGVEDRKIRKKEQNKNAATRYRQKKKEEMKHVLDEEQHLQETNAELRRQLADRRNESRYLRQLIREFYKDKQ